VIGRAGPDHQLPVGKWPRRQAGADGVAQAGHTQMVHEIAEEPPHEGRQGLLGHLPGVLHEGREKFLRQNEDPSIPHRPLQSRNVFGCHGGRQQDRRVRRSQQHRPGVHRHRRLSVRASVEERVSGSRATGEFLHLLAGQQPLHTEERDQVRVAQSFGGPAHENHVSALTRKGFQLPNDRRALLGLHRPARADGRGEDDGGVIVEVVRFRPHRVSFPSVRL
jgi:hypothetical protein